MHIGIIGAGVVGLTTANALLNRSHSVTLVEALEQPAMQTSFANGAQLSYSFTDPLASPELIKALPRILRGLSPGIRIQHRADLEYLSWSARFLWNCLPHRQRRNAKALERLAARSSELMTGFRDQSELPYYHKDNGKLVLLSEPPGRSLLAGIERKRSAGLELGIHTRAETIELAPQLERWNSAFSHSVYAPADSVADAREFTRVLAKQLQSRGVVAHYNEPVTRLVPEQHGVTLVTHSKEITVDATVVCAGNQSDKLLGSLGINTPILPITGYSLTLPRGNDCPNLSITAMAERTVFAPLESQVRIAGFADIHPTSTEQSGRIEELLATAAALAPNAASYATSDNGAWVGHRPSTPDGVPRVGATKIPRVFENTGHGSLGWTLAAATAEILSDAIETPS